MNPSLEARSGRPSWPPATRRKSFPGGSKAASLLPTVADGHDGRSWIGSWDQRRRRWRRRVSRLLAVGRGSVPGGSKWPGVMAPATPVSPSLEARSGRASWPPAIAVNHPWRLRSGRPSWPPATRRKSIPGGSKAASMLPTVADGHDGRRWVGTLGSETASVATPAVTAARGRPWIGFWRGGGGPPWTDC